MEQGVYNTPEHITRNRPKRVNELLNGGSIYWVIGGYIQARQRILRLESRLCLDGILRCAIIMDREIISTRPVPKQAFQGWRYLEPNSSPKDYNFNFSPKDELPVDIATEIDKFGVI